MTVDEIFEKHRIEVRPRVYRYDIWTLKWCCEIIDWKIDDTMMVISGCDNKNEAINRALDWLHRIVKIS